MKVTIAKFIEMFPGMPFCLRYVERGEHKQRAFGWHARFTSDYFTSDSDRLVDDHHQPSFTTGWGSTPEEALGEIIVGMLNSASSKVKHDEERLREDRAELERLVAKWNDATT